VDLTQPSGLNLSDTTDATLDYKNALDRIKKALDARENKAYDPHLLAISQGLLTPGKTGSFFEGVAQAAGNVRDVQGQLQKEEVDNAQMRLQLAKAEREQDQLEKAQRAALGFTGAGGSSGAGGKGAPSSGGSFKPVSIEDATRFAIAFPNQKELAKTMMDAAKAGMDRFMSGPNGSIFDKLANGGQGGYVEMDIPGQKQEKFSTPYGSFDMTPNEYARFTKALGKDLGREWMEAFKKGSTSKVDAIVMGVAPSAAAEKKDVVSPATPDGGRKTTSESEAEAAAAKERAVKMAGSEAERTNTALDAAKSARGLQAGFTRANEILADPKIKDYLGVLSRGDVTSALGNLVNEAFRVGNFSIGIPAVKKILTESGAPQEMIDKLAELGQIEAMWQMESRKGLGAGTSVSNMEQMMANRVTPSQDDPFGAYMQKLKFLQEKAKFDVELARELKRSKLTYDQFEDTQRFDTIFNAYQNRLMGIVSPSSGKSNAKANTTTTTSKITAEDLKRELGK
jgi:hypothetical protein